MKTCEQCGTEFTPRHANRAGRFHTLACYHASGRPDRKAVTDGPRVRRVPGHPLAPPSGTVAECRLVLYDKIGPDPHPCHWCKKPVEWKPEHWNDPGTLVADHLDWDIHNNDPANLVPSCRVCNAHRVKGGGRALIHEDELFIVNANGSRTRAIKRYCLICGEEFLGRISQVKAGKALYKDRSCARTTRTADRYCVVCGTGFIAMHAANSEVHCSPLCTRSEMELKAKP